MVINHFCSISSAIDIEVAIHISIVGIRYSYTTLASDQRSENISDSQPPKHKTLTRSACA